MAHAENSTPKKQGVIGKLVYLLAVLLVFAGAATMVYGLIQQKKADDFVAPEPEKTFSSEDPDTFVESTKIGESNETVGEYTDPGETEAVNLKGWKAHWLPLSDTPQGLPEEMKSAWQCSEDTQDGGYSWDKASRVSGAAVFIPELCVVTPLIETGAEPILDREGNKTYDSEGHLKTSLVLPSAPVATRFTGSSPIGSDKGSTIIASHVNYNNLDLAPFSRLTKAEKGTPIMVRKANGDIVVYKAYSSMKPQHNETPNVDEIFDTEGKPLLRLITCAGAQDDSVQSGSTGYKYNFILTAKKDYTIPVA